LQSILVGGFHKGRRPVRIVAMSDNREKTSKNILHYARGDTVIEAGK
jgi:hypothetical protein